MKKYRPQNADMLEMQLADVIVRLARMPSHWVAPRIRAERERDQLLKRLRR